MIVHHIASAADDFLGVPVQLVLVNAQPRDALLRAFAATATATRGKTSHSSIVGRMCSGERLVSAMPASAAAAATHISSVIVRARTSSAPRKMPGKPRELLTWLAKSPRPVATTAAPAAIASHGHISGIGLAHRKTIAFFPIFATHSFWIVLGPGVDSAMHTSAPSSASAIPPSRRSALVVWHSRHLSTYSALRSSISREYTPAVGENR